MIYAAAYQRRRAVGQLIGGGPESGLYKSTNGGQTWTKLTKGLPTVEIGRIGLGINWRNPERVYALVTAQRGQGGFFRSDDAGRPGRGSGAVPDGGAVAGAAGGTAPAACGPIEPGAAKPPGGAPRRRRGGASDDCYRGGDPGYYNEIFVDAHDPETIWSLQTNVDRSADGGKTWAQVAMPGVHVDHHEIVFDPPTSNHIIIGNDGGLYETYDGMKTWRHFTNLPLSQFYRIAVDNARPFYNVCGGAQDNGTICGPSRTVEPRRHPHQRLVQRRRRRRLPVARRPRRLRHRLRAVAGRRAQPARSATGQIGVDPSAAAEHDVDGKPPAPGAAGRQGGGRGGGRRRASAAGTGTRRSSSARTSHAAALLRRRARLPQRRSRRLVGRRSARDLTRKLDADQDPDHGQGLAARLGRLQPGDDDAQHDHGARRVAAARRTALRRHRRRPGSGDRGRRQDLAQGRDSSPASPSTPT